jgi:hypothetical protein
MLDGERGSWPAWTDHKIILRDTGRAMSEESTTHDLVELTRRQFEAVNRRDMDAVMSRFAPDGVYDTLPAGLMVYEGPAAIRAFIVEWLDAFEELALEPEEVLDLGHGILLSVVCRERPSGQQHGSFAETRGVRP